MSMDLVALARRIRAARTQKGMTCETLARRTGVSKSLISRVENFRVTPSLPVLLRLAEALGISPGDLLNDVSSARQRVIIVRKKERNELSRNPERPGFRYFELAGTEQNKAMSSFVIELLPRTKRYRPMPHEGEDFCLVLKGRVRFKVDEEDYVLKPGDSIYLDGSMPHSIACVGKSPARMLNVIAGMGANSIR